MPIDNVDAVMAEMDADIKESGEDKFGRKPEEVAEAEGVVEADPVDAVIADAKDKGAAEDEEDEEELERQAASEDPRKRNGVFGKFRKENKELRQAVEDERKAKQELAERVARLEGRHEASAKIEPAAVVEKDEEPDRLIYPDDHRDWQIRQMQKRVEAAETGYKTLQQVQQATQEEQAVTLLEGQYKTSNPKESYDDAVKFLWDREKANKKVLQPGLTDAQIDVQIRAEKVQLFKNLYANGQRNGAEVLVQLAKNAGWSAGAVAGVKKEVDLKKVQDNQRRTSNLIGGSAASKGSASSDDILNMSLKKAMRVAHENPGAFDGEYGES